VTVEVVERVHLIKGIAAAVSFKGKFANFWYGRSGGWARRAICSITGRLTDVAIPAISTFLTQLDTVIGTSREQTGGAIAVAVVTVVAIDGGAVASRKTVRLEQASPTQAFISGGAGCTVGLEFNHLLGWKTERD